MHVPLRRALGLLVIIGATLWFSLGSLAYKTGPMGTGIDPTLNGCNCHGANPSAGTVITFSGLPATFEAEKTYPLIVSSTSDVSRVSNPQFVGGFHVQATGGAFAAAGSTQAAWVQTGSAPAAWIEHTEAGARANAADASKVQKWEITWKAPKSGDVRFNVYVNRVNGDVQSDGNDRWNQKEATVAGPAGDGAGGKGPGFGVVAGVVALAAALAWTARRRF